MAAHGRSQVKKTILGMAALASITLLAALPATAAPPPAAAKTTTVKAAPASSATGVGQGDFEFTVFGLFISPDDGDSITLLGTSGGYYFADNIVAKASLFLVESGGSRTGELGLGGDYLFSSFKPAAINTPFVPYAGASFLIGIGDGESFPEIHGGLKQFIGERVSVNYELQRWLGDFKSTNLLAQLSFYF